MKTKIAGIMIMLAGTATVFAATHKSLNSDSLSDVSGTAGFFKTINEELSLEMEFVGLQPNDLYVVRLENSGCQSLPARVSAFPSGLAVAMFVEPNDFGSYSAVMKGLPSYAETAHSIALYKTSDAPHGEIETVYCQNIG